jgi:hypothetical protein
MTLAIIFDQLQNTVAVLVLSSLVLTGVRRIQKISRPLGTILAVGVIARMAVGLALFWTSYLNLPILESLQAGNGFWQVALDARSYYETAASAAESGRLVALDHSSASPFFLNTLAVWMMLVGISPAAAMFLNLCLYVLLMMGIAWTFKPVNDWRRDLPVLVCTAAYSFSPVIVIHSTQPLKDELAAVLVGLTCVAVAWLARLMNSVQPRRLEWPVLIATLVFAFSIFGVAGTRWYYGFVLWCSLALVFGIFALGRRTVPLPRYLTACFLVLLVSWFGFREGAGPYYDAVTPSLDGRFAWQSAAVDPSEPKKSGISALLGRLANVPTYFAERTSAARTGFVMSGGATNVLVSVRHESTPPLAASPGSPSGSTPASSGVATVSRSAPLIAAVPPLPSGFDANEAFASATPSVEVAVAGIGAPTVFVSTASMPAAPEAAAAASSIASDSTIARSAPVTLAAATGDVPAAMATGRDPNTFEPVPVADPTANLAASDGLASPPSLLVAVSPPAATLNGQQSAVTTSAPPATSGATPQAEVAMPVGTAEYCAISRGNVGECECLRPRRCCHGAAPAERDHFASSPRSVSTGRDPEAPNSDHRGPQRSATRRGGPIGQARCGGSYPSNGGGTPEGSHRRCGGNLPTDLAGDRVMGHRTPRRPRSAAAV